jgi:hypothetical protein
MKGKAADQVFMSAAAHIVFSQTARKPTYRVLLNGREMELV